MLNTRSLNPHHSYLIRVPFSSGSIESHLYILITGKARLQTNSKEWREMQTYDATGITSIEAKLNREETLEATSNCEFCVIRRKNIQDGDFKSEKEFEEFVSFSKHLYYFKNWPRYWICNLLKNCGIKEYIKGDNVFKAGDCPKYMYIVKSGEFLTFYRPPNTILKRQFSTSENVVEYQNLNFYINPSLKYMASNKLVNVSLLTKGTLIGEDNMISNTPYAFGLICQSATGELIEVKKDSFFGLISKSENSLNTIRSTSISRNKFHNDIEEEGKKAISKFNVSMYKNGLVYVEQKKMVKKPNTHFLDKKPISLTEKLKLISQHKNRSLSKSALDTTRKHINKQEKSQMNITISLKSAGFGKLYSKCNDQLMFTLRKSLSRLVIK